MRVFDEIFFISGKGFIYRGLIIAQNSREKSGDRVHQNHRGKLAARQDIGSNRNLLVNEFGHALIESFIMTAQ